jgi:hypothetical protein
MANPRLAVLVFLFLFVPLSLAGGQNPEGAPIMSDVTERGRALYEYDQAAWHATDALKESNPALRSLGLYIAHKSGNRWSVAFGHLTEQRDRFLVGYEAKQGAALEQFQVRKLDPPREETGFCLSAARAIATALRDFHGEKRQYNLAVLPAFSEELYVYIVPAQTKDGVYPLGGDVRYLITADGASVLEKRQLHQGIVEVSLDSAAKGTMSPAGAHTHILSNVPEDTDVFYVLTRKPQQPEFINTPDKKLYEISPDGTIRELKK